MAVSFWLPKVIVILTVCGISCAFDDLLDRVRLSASNDPEVRDFLNAVLKHRSDINWVQQFITKGHPEHILPLHGLPLKNKRSFYSHRASHPFYRSYGYKPHRYAGYERPINDAYPYEEEEESESKFYQKPNENSEYNKRNAHVYPQYDFLDEDEVVNHKHRKKREVEDYEFEQHEVPANLNKREQDVEKLLNEKMILHSLLHNKERPKFRKVFKDNYEKNLPSNLEESDWDEVHIFPNSEKGVLYAPGNKYEYKGDGCKRCVDDTNLGDHEYVEDLLHKKTNLSLEAPLGEFYYSNPHDILGITKDQQMEMHEHSISDVNATKTKRSIHLDDLLNHSGKRARNEDKSIKIKIFDDGRLVKDIKKGDANSIVLTIKNDKGNNGFQSTERPHFHDTNKIMDDLSIYSNMLPVYQSIRDDNTLQKIDSIIQRDQASLKLNSQIPYGAKQKKDVYISREDNINQLIHDITRDLNKKSSKERSVKSNKLHSDFDSSESPRKSFPSDHLAKHKIDFQRADEIDSGVENRNVHGDSDNVYEYHPKTSKKILQSNSVTNFDAEPIESEPVPNGEHQNRLEEQSEPTSAAEQRELGRINNSFNTPSMDVITTDKMMIIPIKKNAKASIEDEVDDEPESRFAVKATRDMIHSKHKKSPEMDNSHGVMLSKNLKDADDVLYQLKNDLEKTLKNDFVKDRIKSITNDNYAGFDDVYNSVNHVEYDENEFKAIQDDNVEIDKETVTVGKVKKSKLGRSKESESSNFVEGADVVDDVRDADDVDENNLRIKKLTQESFRMRKLMSFNERRNPDKEMEDNFKIRKLMSVKDDEKNKDVSKIIDQNKNNEIHNRYKRSMADFLGMSNDEDYSEDKVDYYDNELKKRSQNNEENNYKMPIFSLIKNVKKKADDKKDKRHHSSVKAKRNLFTNKMDYIGKRDDSDEVDESESPSEEPVEENSDSDKEKQSVSGGNELDIIEKTQAILLHITNPPGVDRKGATTMRGEYDDNDDPNVKFDENRDADNDFKGKHSNMIKLQSFDKNDDIVGAIMKLVNNYKENENRKHVQEKKSKFDNVKYNHDIDNYDDSEESSFSHHLHKDKKAHPTSINIKKCTIKPGTDHYHTKHVDQEMHYDFPKAVKESFADVEVMSDKDKHEDNEMKRDLENPLKFTPDRLDSFRDIIESPRYRRNLRNYNDRMKYFEKYDERYIKNMNKRHAKAVEDPLKTLGDMNNVHKISKYNFNPYFYPNLQRFRQQAVPQPANQAKPDSSEASSGSVQMSTTVSISDNPSSAASGASAAAVGNPAPGATTAQVQGTAANLITTSTFRPKIDPNKLKSCLPIESTTPNVNISTCKPPTRKTHRPHGIHCHPHGHPSPETLRERNMRERNREKMREDILREKLKEHEHLKDLLNGHIMMDIMGKFQDRIKKNDKLNSRFGHAVGKKCAAQEVALINRFREEQSKKDIKHAQLMLHQVIIMMNKIVADQVHRRSCVVLAPEIKDYVTKLANVLKGTSKSMQVAEGYPLPQVGSDNGNHPLRPEDQQPDFLFDNPKEDTETTKTNPEVAMRRKIGMLRRLLSKYNHMSEKCQVKVQPVKEYLQQHLDMLEKMLMENKYESDFNELVCTISPAYVKQCKNFTTTETGADITTATTAKVAAAANAPTTSTAATPATPHSGRAAPKNEYEDDFANSFFDRNFDKFEVAHGKRLSEKYKKLVEAADNYRRKREIEQRLAHLFGRKRRESDEGKKKEDEEDLNSVAFEAPLVYSLDG